MLVFVFSSFLSPPLRPLGFSLEYRELRELAGASTWTLPLLWGRSITLPEVLRKLEELHLSSFLLGISLMVILFTPLPIKLSLDVVFLLCRGIGAFVLKSRRLSIGLVVFTPNDLSKIHSTPGSQGFDLIDSICKNAGMAERIDTRKFVDGVLGRKWDNFPSRVAATYYIENFVNRDLGETGSKVKEKLLRLISPEDLNSVIKEYGKR